LGEDSEKSANGRFSERINGRWLEEEGIHTAREGTVGTKEKGGEENIVC
jgi:hypothetical protein